MAGAEWSVMISRKQQRLISMGLIGVAFGALVLAAIYQDDDKLGDTNFVGVDQTTNGQATNDQATTTTLAPVIVGEAAAIEDFLPRGGDAVACEEDVGVDLANGYGARLTINGKDVPEEIMDLARDPEGEVIPGRKSAFRSIGYYTFRPDDNCPNGQWLRPVDNVLDVCVFRLDDPGQECTVRSQYVFSAA